MLLQKQQFAIAKRCWHCSSSSRCSVIQQLAMGSNLCALSMVVCRALHAVHVHCAGFVLFVLLPSSAGVKCCVVQGEGFLHWYLCQVW